MIDYLPFLVTHLAVALSIVVWLAGRSYTGKKGILWLLAFTLPIPTLIYLYVVYRFTDDLKKL